MSIRPIKQLLLERPLYRSFLHNDHLPLFPVTSVKNVSVGCYWLYNFPSFLYLFLLKISYFISTEKWNKKGKYRNEVQIITFLLEHRFVDVKTLKRNFKWYIIWSENVFKENLMLQFSWLEEFHWGKASRWWTLGELQCKKGLNIQL